jgi:hypothetical protein
MQPQTKTCSAFFFYGRSGKAAAFAPDNRFFLWHGACEVMQHATAQPLQTIKGDDDATQYFFEDNKQVGREDCTAQPPSSPIRTGRA